MRASSAVLVLFRHRDKVALFVKRLALGRMGRSLDDFREEDATFMSTLAMTVGRKVLAPILERHGD
jgi:hypothetical protein